MKRLPAGRAVCEEPTIVATGEELTKPTGAAVLVSEETRRRIGDAIPFVPAGAAPLRGRPGTVATYTPEAPC